MERLPITVAHRPLPVAIDIVHCYCPSAIAHLQLPVWCCPSAVARRPLPIGRWPLAVAHRPLPISHHPSAIARRPLPIGPYQSAVTRRPSPIRHYSSAVAHHPWLLPFIHHRCLLSKEIFYGDETVRQIFLVVFCQNFFMEMGQWDIFFFLSFVNMTKGAWRWDSVTIFFVVFLSSSVSCLCCKKKFITWFQYSITSHITVAYWSSFVKN